MVAQLRAALADRVADAAPSPGAWEAILERTRAPEPQLVGWRAWSSAVVGRLRLTALAASSLALILALNSQVIPLSVPSTTDGSTFTETIRLGRGELRAASGRVPNVPALAPVASVADAVGALTVMTPLPPAADEGNDEGGMTEEHDAGGVRIVFLPADTYPAEWADAADEAQEEGAAADPMPLASEPGEPS
jgi:hypothetical protein